MDWNRVEGNWKQDKGKVKEPWGKLSDDELDRIAGKRDQLEGKIQERCGIEKDRVRRDIDDWASRQGWSLRRRINQPAAHQAGLGRQSQEF